MAKTLSELITAPAIAAYWQNLASNEIPYLGPTLFPAKRMQGLRLDWIKGKDELPVQLAPSALDTKPTLRDRGGVAKVGLKMPFFREAMRIGEEDRQQLLQLARANDSMVDSVVSRVFDDAAGLIKGAQVNPEVMIFQLLQTGKISITSASDSGQDVNYDFNYDPQGTWNTSNFTTLAADNQWGKPKANIVADLLAAKRKAAQNGVVLTRAIVSPTVWGTMVTDPSIGKDTFPLNTNAALSDSDLQSYLLRKTGLQVTSYAKMYKDTNKVQHNFMDNDKVVLLPSNAVGSTYYGTTPEEADLRGAGAPAGASVSIVEGGISVLTFKEVLPVNVVTSVSEIVLPSYENMDSVYVLKVA